MKPQKEKIDNNLPLVKLSQLVNKWYQFLLENIIETLEFEFDMVCQLNCRYILFVWWGYSSNIGAMKGE